MPVAVPERTRDTVSTDPAPWESSENSWGVRAPLADDDPEPDVPDVDDFEPPHDDDAGDDDDDGDGDPVRWVTVATFWHSTRAHIARLKLESEDVDCVLFDENLNWLCATSGGGIKLQVPEPDAARARWILQSRVAGAHSSSSASPPQVPDYVEDESSAPGRTNFCPHCGEAAGEVLPVFRRAGAVAVPLVIAGVIAAASPAVSLLIAAASCLTFALPRYRCPRCGGEWAASGNNISTARGFDVLPPAERPKD